MAGMNARSLPRLDRRKDLEGTSPPGRIELEFSEAERFKVGGNPVQGVHNLRIAIVQELVVDYGKAVEVRARLDMPWREYRPQQRRVLEISKKPPHRVEGLRQMRSATPVAASQRRSVAS